MGEDVVAPHVVDKGGLLQEPGRLIPRATEQQRTTGLPQPVGELLQRVQPRRIDGRRVAQPQDHHRRKPVEIRRLLHQLVRGPEQEGPVDAQDRDVRRHLLILEDVRAPALDVLLGHRGDGGGLRDAIDVE